MGAVARRIEAEPFARRSTHLRLVTTPAAPAPARLRSDAGARARGRAVEARAKAAFMAFLAVFACAIVLGGARVTLLVQASEASIVESRVQVAIKTQRAQVDQLEMDRSALSTPSRIAGIASTSMDMGEPASVRYIALTSGAVSGQDPDQNEVSAGSPQSDLLGRVLTALTELSAGEAQSLLVGDLGLAGSR